PHAAAGAGGVWHLSNGPALRAVCPRPAHDHVTGSHGHWTPRAVAVAAVGLARVGRSTRAIDARGRRVDPGRTRTTLRHSTRSTTGDAGRHLSSKVPHSQGRTMRLPLIRFTRRRISSTLIVDSTCGVGSLLATTTSSIVIGLLAMAASTCCSVWLSI